MTHLDGLHRGKQQNNVGDTLSAFAEVSPSYPSHHILLNMSIFRLAGMDSGVAFSKTMDEDVLTMYDDTAEEGADKVRQTLPCLYVYIYTRGDITTDRRPLVLGQDVQIPQFNPKKKRVPEAAAHTHCCKRAKE